LKSPNLNPLSSVDVPFDSSEEINCDFDSRFSSFLVSSSGLSNFKLLILASLAFVIGLLVPELNN